MLTEEQIEKKEEEQKKIMDEPTLDEVWDDAVLDEDEKEEEKAEEKGEDKEEEVKDGEEKEEEDDEKDGEDEEEKKEPENEIDWEALGFPKFKGKSDKEVAEQIKFERQQLGHTVNMLGDLRRENADLKSKKESKEEKKPEKKDTLSSIPELNDADAAKFNTLYENNPIRAIMTYGGGTISEMIKEEVAKAVPKESIGEVKEEIAYTTFLNTAKPTDVEVEQMQIFDDPLYLGGQKRSYSDLHNLSKMWLSEDEDIAAIRDNVYGLMVKHPTMGFDEARGNFAPKEEKKVPTVDKKKIKETINKNKKAESHPKAKAKALPDKNKSFDDTWDEA